MRLHVSSSMFKECVSHGPLEWSSVSLSQFCIMPSDKRSPNFIFYVSKTKISDLVRQTDRHTHTHICVQTIEGNATHRLPIA